MENNLKIYDISLTLEPGMVTYHQDIPYQRSLQRDLSRGDSSNVSMFETSAHVGTHVDAPLHYFPRGYGIDKIPLEHLYGPAFVADCRHLPAVTADALHEKVPPGTKRLLLKTDNSQLLHDNPHAPFNKNFVYLDDSAARFCVDINILLVGIDYLSIDKSGLAAKPAHHLLLGHDITILEGIVLAHVEPGEYFLVAGPLKMANSDGAPCRAILLKNLT